MYRRVARISKDALHLFSKDTTPLLYFSKVPNVGDLVSVYLVEKITGRKVVQANSRVFPHLSAVGSTIGSCASTSYIWGSGSIDGQAPRRKLNAGKIFALRGKGTLGLLEKETGSRLSVSLGDPAVLMPLFYDEAQPMKYKIGIVPHFDEYARIKSLLKSDHPEVCLIDVRQEPQKFIQQIRCCSIVMSSSLHGLILADSYDIPNIWISATNLLLGHGWKFRDYFSTTALPDQSPLRIIDSDGLLSALNCAPQLAKVRSFKESSRSLLDSFPDNFKSSKIGSNE